MKPKYQYFIGGYQAIKFGQDEIGYWQHNQRGQRERSGLPLSWFANHSRNKKKVNRKTFFSYLKDLKANNDLTKYGI